MILLWGVPADEPMAAVADSLRLIGAPTAFIAQSNYRRVRFDLDTGASPSGNLVVGGRTFDLDTIYSAYIRPYETPASRGEGRGAPTPQRAFEIENRILAWSELTRALVVNRPSAMGSNYSKPYQLEIIRSAGFRIPSTMITTDPDAVREFWSEHREVVYKSISGIRSIVKRLSDEHLERMSDVANCPTQFQEYVPGVDFRVHVVGDATFTTQVISTADDYRYASARGLSVRASASSLPREVEERCLALTRRLGLVFAGLDLRLGPTGEWFCFEANPSPAFTFYQALTGQKIGEAVARLLAFRD